MFGVRLNQVFASRWKALLWSLGVLATAYCSVPDRDEPAAPDAAAAQAAIQADLGDIPQIPQDTE